MTRRHLLIPESTDPAGRRWCQVCGLPETNQIHQPPAVEDEGDDDTGERHS